MMLLQFVPILLRPKAIAVRNVVRQGTKSYQQTVRASVLIAFALGVAYAIFYGTRLLIVKIHEHIDVAYVPPSVPLGLLLLFIMMMLLLSCGVSAIGALFHARDLDLVLAAPISKQKFYFSKFLEILISSSWLVMIFGIPALLGFASAYHAPFSFYPLVVVVLLPYFVIPTIIAVIFATLFSSLLPANRTRELFGIITVVTFLGLFYLFRLLMPSDASWQDINTMLRMIAILLRPNGTWTPSYWASAVLSENLEPAGRPTGLYLVLLYATATSGIALAYCALRILHFPALSRARASRLGARTASSARPLLIALVPAPRRYKAIMTKEFKIFTRDITQALQLLLLLGLCSIYLYNLRLLHAVEGMDPVMRTWWEGFLMIVNICLGAFITSAMCTRFVFPSISLEGQTFWILQTSPCSIGEILRAKLLTWYFPVALVSCIVFSAGAFAINAAPAVVVLNVIISFVISYGIVGLALGLGAHFANFDWEHPSQLAASFGSLVFMLVSVLTIFSNMIPPLVLVFLRAEWLHAALSDTRWYSSVVCTMALLLYLNFAITRWALTVGENSLLERQQK